jgi:hypothetical protein
LQDKGSFRDPKSDAEAKKKMGRDYVGRVEYRQATEHGNWIGMTLIALLIRQ